jgi:predicted phage baseplate assembly protein
MTDSTPEPTLDACGCCEANGPDEPVQNAAGLPALRYRLASHGRFLERMLQALPLSRPPGMTDQSPVQPLARLTARTADDPTVALLDACANVADILTFYQERIANEGFLRTATERRSVLELARAIGYELAPGVAASVHLSFTVEDAPGAPGVAVIPKGTQMQSVPPPDKLPQVFETSENFTARSEWNALRPRLTRPAELAILADRVSPPGTRLCLLAAVGSFPPATPGLIPALDVQSLYRLDPTTTLPATMAAVEVTRVYFTETAATLAKGELLLFAAKKEGGESETLVLRVADVVPEPAAKRVRVDLEPLPSPTVPDPPTGGLKLFPALVQMARTFSTVRLGTIAFDRTNVEGTVFSRTWRERDLQALIGIQRWRGASIVKTAKAKLPAPAITFDTGAFSFREKLAFFGHNAPKWGMLPIVPTKTSPYGKGWDVGDPDNSAGTPTLLQTRSIWTDSQGDSLGAHGLDAYLEHPVAGVVQKSWIVIESAEQTPKAYSVYDAREASRADYGLSGRAMALTLVDDKGLRLTSAEKPHFPFRTTTARANSSRLELAELPIASPIERGTTALELDRMVLGLSVGQAIVFQGVRADMPGVDAAEIAFLSDVIHEGGRTTLMLSEGLDNAYVRDTLTINANAVHASHGETVREILGSGDASIGNQRFALKKPPLTYVSASTPRGVRSSLEVRVNGVRWDGVPSLYGVGPNREVYVVRIDDDARAQVVFGDGQQGARVPTGAVNVSATYRSGIGPDGEVEAGSLTILRVLPLGLRGVTNALAARGAEEPEHLQNARRNAPLTVLTFDRVVSLTDYEDFARTFQGIGKALADRLWVGGRDLVHLTVAGATGSEPGNDVVSNLKTAIQTASDGSQPFVVSPFAQRYFTCQVRVAINPRFVVTEVLAAVEERLRTAFSFEARTFGQSVTGAEVITLVQQLAGVLAVDLESLIAYEDDGTVSGAPSAPESGAVLARRARWNPDAKTLEPAELLLVNPVGIVLSEMAP